MFEILKMTFQFESENGIYAEGYSNSIASLGIMPEELVLMQFTGLKDKNGKEIYEGDVIRTHAYNEKWNDGAIGWVEMREGEWKSNWVQLLAKSGERSELGGRDWICSGALFSDRETGIEVIGNIYSNPDLLT